MSGTVTRVPILAIAIVLACAGLVGSVYLRTRPQASPSDSGAAVVQVDRVAQAVKLTSSAKSFAFGFSMSLTAGPGDPFTMSGTGSVDLPRHLIGFSAHVENAAAAQPIESVVDYSHGFVDYLHSDAFAGHLPAGKSWVKVDVGKYAKKEGVDIGRLMRSNDADPTKVLDMLRRAGTPTLVGQETLGGASMAHYRSVVDVRRLVATEPDATVRASLQRAMELSGTTSFPVDVWIDDRGYLRRAQWTETETLPDGRNTPATTSFTEDLSRFDAGAAVALPPGSSVVDAADLG
jgi:hypothetical protein